MADRDSVGNVEGQAVGPKHPERNDYWREYGKAWRANNIERARAQKRAQMKRWRERNPERAREIWRNNYVKNRAARLAYARKQHQENRAHTLSVRYLSGEALERFKGKYEFGCVYCGSSQKLQIDHKHPRSRGGLDVEENLQWLCAVCNRAKNNLTDDEFLAHLKLVLDKITRRS